jgi:hypothetical protein
VSLEQCTPATRLPIPPPPRQTVGHREISPHPSPFHTSPPTPTPPPLIQVKLWGVKSSECAATLDAHSDKVWALDAFEPPAGIPTDTDGGGRLGGLQLVSGSADSVIVRWADTSAATAGQATAASLRAAEDEQRLANAIASGGGRGQGAGVPPVCICCLQQASHSVQMQNSSITHPLRTSDPDLPAPARSPLSPNPITSSPPPFLPSGAASAAFAAALSLLRPRALLSVLRSIPSTPSGDASLQAAVAEAPDPDALAFCLECVRDWSTRAQHALAAHRLLHAILKVRRRVPSAPRARPCPLLPASFVLPLSGTPPPPPPPQVGP